MRLLKAGSRLPGRKILAAFLALALFPVMVFAQNRTVNGQVRDESGAPIPAATIRIKGKTTGTVADGEGRFQLTAPTGVILQVSSYGYESQEITPGTESSLKVMLKTKSELLTDVVVVGYGSQKKAHVTGSVASISGKQLQDRPVTNVSSALAGLASGVMVRQNNGKPGDNNTTVQIRGIGTMSSTTTLVLVDGIIGSMDAVNPADIESISVLKDASASIYGTLAANGVILITTKKGAGGKPALNYSGTMSVNAPMNLPSFVSDYARHMRLINEGFTNVNQAAPFSQTTINAWDSASRIPNQLNPIGVPNSIAYPNTSWSDVLFENLIMQNHNLSVSGGSDNTKYLFSGGILNNPGTIQNTGNKRYQLRANLETKINKFLTVGTQTFGNFQTYEMGNTNSAFNFLRQTTPGLVPYYNGKYGYAQAPDENQQANGILAFLNNTAGSDESTSLFSTVYATVNIIKGLTFETRFNYQTGITETKSHTNPDASVRWDFGKNEQRTFLPNPADLTTTYYYARSYRTTVDNLLRYTTKIGRDHDLSAFVGYNQNYYNFYDVNAIKQGLIDYNITTPGSALLPTATTGTEYDNSLRSWFGRVNYAFQGKYLLETNLRYDGSSRFGPDARWGFFPSVLAGWRISDEQFMANTRGWLDNLKLRASWGKMGNIASGNYDWQATYASRPYSFNNLQAAGLAVGKYANSMLQWETTQTTNIGLEGSMFRDKLIFEVDVYRRQTDGILTQAPIPLTAGNATAPTENTAQAVVRGIDLTLGTRGKIGEVGYLVSGNIAYNKNEITRYKGKLVEGYVKDASGNLVYQSNFGAINTAPNSPAYRVEGHMIDEYYLYKVYSGSGSYKNSDGTVNINGGPKDGMIRTPEDLDWAKSMLAAGYKLRPANNVSKTGIYYGDLVYADLNGDGDYGNSYDRYFTGSSSLPKIVFGLNAQVTWRNFDLSMLWAGGAGHKFYWNADGYNASYVIHGNAVPTLVADNHYYYNEANPTDPNNNINGKYTRLKANDPQNRAVASDYWLYDASWAKLKNLQVGWNIPAKWATAVFMQRARVYVSGENLLLITKFPGLDPEIGSGVGYPTMKQYAFGVNLTF
ncbi:SusC/RagA family TonB-linked outer membrane protein [Chitinophaga lutea]